MIRFAHPPGSLRLSIVTTGTLWCFAPAWLSSRLSDRPKFSTILNRTAGALFIGLGVRLAVSRQDDKGQT